MGCQPVECVETYSPMGKLLMGAPIPTFVTMVLAALLLMGISRALGRTSDLPKGGSAVVAATCLWPAICLVFSWPDGFFVVWPALLVVLIPLSLRDRERDPNQQSWMHNLSGAQQPSVANRITAGLLVTLLLLVTLIGSVVTMAAVGFAGQECHELDSAK
jgi:hypothetical protein